MIRDPLDEVLVAVERVLAGEVLNDSDRAALALARRRFGVAFPAPLLDEIVDCSSIPLRPAVALDAAAIAVVARSGQVLDQLSLRMETNRWRDLISASRSRRPNVIVAGSAGSVYAAMTFEDGLPSETFIDPTLSPEPLRTRLLTFEL